MVSWHGRRIGSWVPSVLEFREDATEAVKPPFPPASVLPDPPLGRAHGGWLQPARAHAPDLLRSHQSAVVQDSNVLPDRRQRHRQRRGKRTHRGRALAQAGDDCAATRVGQGVEHPVEQIGLVAHAASVAEAKAISLVLSRREGLPLFPLAAGRASPPLKLVSEHVHPDAALELFYERP
jgi:hypothetical protein